MRRRVPARFTPPGCAFAVGLPVLAVLALAIGMTLPAWGPAVAAPVRELRYRRTYRRLDPLWRELASAMPEIVLPRSGRDRFSYRYGLHRRVIEIRDGLLLLGPYRDSVGCPPETTVYGAGLAGDQEAAELEAIFARRALVAYRSGEPIGGETDALAPTGTNVEAGPQDEAAKRAGAGGDLDSEAAWLTRVSLAFSALAGSVDVRAEKASQARP